MLSLALFLASCNHNAVEKPENLIEEEVMTNILYDLSIMEAMKSQNPYAPQNQSINPKEYIFKKYKKKVYPPTFGSRKTITRIISYQTYPIKNVMELDSAICKITKNPYQNDTDK